MVDFTAPQFANDAFLTECLNGTKTMGDRPNRQPPEEHPHDSVVRFQTALTRLGIPVTIDGQWGPETYDATLLFKTILDIRTDDGFLDGYVGVKTMTAMEALFGVAPYEIAAAASPFSLGARAGGPSDAVDGITTVAFDYGLVIGLDAAVHLSMPAPLSDQWLADGGTSSVEGRPIADAVALLDVGAAQRFEGGSLVATQAGSVASLPDSVLAELEGAQAGLPVGDPTTDPSGEVTLLEGESGTVLWAEGGPALAVPPSVADQWSADAAAGNSLGPPTALAFAIPAATVFPFAAGHLALSETGVVTRTAVPPPSLDRYRRPADPNRHFEAAADGNDVSLLIGGPKFFFELSSDLASVGSNGFVYLSSWNCDIDLPCLTGGRTLRQELTRLTALGVEVKMQLWAARPATSSLSLSPQQNPQLRILSALAEAAFLKANTNNPVAINAVTTLPNSFAFADENHAKYGSHHQKVILVGTGSTLVAYVGGVEFTDDRVAHVSDGAPLFDVSVRISGPATKLVLTTFAERWAAHPQGATNSLNHASFTPPAASVGSQRVQIGHTYAKGFPFPLMVRTASEMAANAIQNATSYFYIEDQYFVGDPRLEAAIQQAFRNGAMGIAVIAAEESVGDLPDIGFRRRKFLSRIAAGAGPHKFLVFEGVGDDGTSTGDHAYIHSKLILVDDEVALIGSMNSSRRSWNHDSEIVASIVDMNGPQGTGPGSPGFAKAARIAIWQLHLKPTALPAVAVPIDDMASALAAWDAALLTPGLSVRPYPPAGSVPKRPIPPMPNVPFVPSQDQILDNAWNTFVDPA